MTEDQILERLKAAFPDGIICNEEYRKKLGGVTIDVRRLARAAGQSSVQWLAAHGFIWKETGYVEPDMKLREMEIPTQPEDAFVLADGVFRKYCLVKKMDALLRGEEGRLDPAPSSGSFKMEPPSGRGSSRSPETISICA